MLASCRTQDDPYTVPPFDLTSDDVDGFLDELQTFHEAFRSCFVRSEPRQHFFHYMAGQFSSLERKSIEPMAIHIEGGSIRGMQRFISDDVWKEPQIQHIYHGMVAHDMGVPQGVLIFDESGPRRSMLGISVKNYRLMKRGVQKSSFVEFSDVESIRQYFSCIILPVFAGGNWGN
jgi:hypothetical protein